ncbi:MAG: methionyl-tRNA formyltransferase [Melioribacteraceae bacterium]|nr:methionyl-tRNA formyltransferase [Melioribacteraceae bacterium]
MKIIFMGTPDFAVPSLEAINISDHQLIGVVTAADKERGRGREISFTPVKDYAIKNKIPVLQPEKLKDPKFIEIIKALSPDLIIVIAFRILPKEIFEIPKYGTFNVHGSLLPKYRGAAPIQWSLINGDTETGLTTFFIQAKVDTGNIILQKKIPIDKEDNFGTLHDKLQFLSIDMVLETIKTIESGNVELLKQDESQVSSAPKITKENSIIDWHQSGEKIYNLIRGLSPYPAAYFKHNSKSYKVFSSKIKDDLILQPGEIVQTKNEIFIGTSTTALEITEIQPEGRKRMKSDDFLRGYSLLKN